MYAASFKSTLRGAVAAAAMGITLFSAANSAHAQQIRTDAPLAAQAVTLREPAKGVSAAECSAFRSFMLEEAREFSDKMSPTFLKSISRFTKAGCATTDAKGEIQIITETDQDGASLRTALRRMGAVDIIGLSGVKGCDRPPNGVCPTKTGAAADLQHGG